MIPFRLLWFDSVQVRKMQGYDSIKCESIQLWYDSKTCESYHWKSETSDNTIQILMNRSSELKMRYG